MKKLIHISVILLFAFGMSSCAKEELESPNQTSNPQAFEDVHHNSIDGTMQIQPTDTDFSPVFINDDGDNEEEGTAAGNSSGKIEPKGK